ncbi:hypothetical protein J6590_000318 [Homalodisca vitripennis]|nr:hypothetical protein J6590_000318 [Homalodisca vitripennis]
MYWKTPPRMLSVAVLGLAMKSELDFGLSTSPTRLRMFYCLLLASRARGGTVGVVDLAWRVKVCSFLFAILDTARQATTTTTAAATPRRRYTIWSGPDHNSSPAVFQPIAQPSFCPDFHRNSQSLSAQFSEFPRSCITPVAATALLYKRSLPCQRLCTGTVSCL